MSTSDYEAFRRIIDRAMADHPMNPVVIERAELRDVHIVSDELMAILTDKARAFDELNPREETEEDRRLQALIERD